MASVLLLTFETGEVDKVNNIKSAAEHKKAGKTMRRDCGQD